jgi:serine protease AprX
MGQHRLTPLRSTGGPPGAARRTGIRAAALAIAVGVTTVLSGTLLAAARAEVTPSLGYDVADSGSPYAVAQMIGAQQAWAEGWTGTGVDVAVIDTGITPVPGLDAAGKLVTGPDLSLDAPGAPVPGLDAHGHGTFMAGLIAAEPVNGSDNADPGEYTGMAPGARLVNVKVGAYDGAVDVTQVIAAVDWVTEHAHDPGMNIRVLNLSFGTDSDNDYQVDPLTHAVERAREQGILVVAAAGNDGKPTKDLADPAYDPYVLAVGGDDPNGTVDLADDNVPDFAQHGTAHRPVDVIAPATHLIGLRVPGSYVDTLDDNAGQVGDRFQRGSGTSQSAAVVSGAAALLFQKYPQADPDTIKAMLNDNAHALLRGHGKASAPGQMLYSGHGIVDVAAALDATPGTDPQTWPTSDGTGDLEDTRGEATVADPEPLEGEQDIFGHPVDTAALAAQRSAGSAWTQGIWNGSRWSGDGWDGLVWQQTTWTGSRWSGEQWSGSRWSDMTWTGSRWSGNGWNGSRWSGSRWSGSRWSGSRWSGSRWSGSRWSEWSHS